MYINQNAAEERLASWAVKSCTLAEVTSLSDVIVTVVDDAAMRAIYLEGEDTLLQGEWKDFINCFTLSPGIHREVAAALARREQIL